LEVALTSKPSPALLALGCLALLLCPLSAQETESDWTAEDPGPVISDDSPSAPEQNRFWDKLNEKVFNQICKRVQLPPGASHRFGGVFDIGGRFKRNLAPMPDGRLAIIDQETLSVGVGSFESALDGLQGAKLPVQVIARFEGSSVVVRPLPKGKVCEQLVKTPIKALLPLNGERISEMAVGEVWKLPLSLQLGLNVSPSVSVGPAVPVSFNITLIAAGENRTRASLNRLSEDRLRFRLHFDHAAIRTAGGAVSLVPFSALGLPLGEGLLAKALGGAAAGMLNRWLDARFSLSSQGRRGERAMVEYLLDPRSSEQMDALAQTIRGDLDALLRVGRPRWLDPDADPDLARELDKEHAGKLGENSSFSGSDRYDENRRSLRLKLPVLLEHDRVKADSHDLVKLYDGNKGRYGILQTERRKSTALLDLPFVGQLFKRTRQQTAQVLTHKEGNEKTEEPLLVFSQQEGFQRGSGKRARRMAEDVDGMMSLAGTRGEGTNERAGLPMDQLLSPPPKLKSEDRKLYRMGALSLTLSFGKEALNDILHADAKTVVRSYLRTLPEGQQERMALALEHGKVKRDGRIDFSMKRLLLDPDVRAGLFDLWQIRRVCKSAAELVSDLAKARKARSPDQRALRIHEMLSDPVKGGLTSLFKTFVQLADPLDLSGEFAFQLAGKGKGGPARRWTLNKDEQDPLLREVGQVRSRFAEPSPLKD